MTALVNVTTTTPDAATSITGRDGYITLKAMLYAIATIQSLPEADREYGDLYDMLQLVHSTAHDMARADDTHDTPILLCHALLEVNRHTGQMPDLWPNDFGDDMSEVYEPRDLAMMGAVKVTIEKMTKDMAAFLAKFNADAGLGQAA